MNRDDLAGFCELKVCPVLPHGGREDRLRLVRPHQPAPEQAIDEDDTSTDAPELWCIVLTDTDEVVQNHMSDADVETFIAEHPEWVDVWSVDDEVRDRVSEAWEE